MIVVGGSGALVVLVLMMLLLALFFLVPVLLLRSATRRGTVITTGWPSGGWSEPAPSPTVADSWSRPPDPVLPPVSAADVSSLRDRLGHDVRTLDPGADPVARQALADASERYSTSSTLLERATSDAQLRTAWLAAVEGMAAAQVVRRQLGLDPGPPVPVLPTAAPPLTSPTQVEVDGRSYSGTPSYEPGRPHWFPGGYHGGRPVPAGWYDVPFWPSALLLGGLGGWMLGGLGAGAVYGDDLGGGLGGDPGSDPGSDLGSDMGSDIDGRLGGGGDWGGDADVGGGGEWGGGEWGGGSDWGGSSDWGGGGDFGGGDGGGGDW